MKKIFFVILLAIISIYPVSATSFAQLHLDLVGSGVKEGHEVIFTGKFSTTDGSSIANRTIFILDDTAYTRPDIILAITKTDSNGDFSASWNAVPKDNGSPYHFYAKFIGGKIYGYTRSEVYESVLEKSDVPTNDIIPPKTMPMWFKNASEMWSSGTIRDVDYGFAIQNMIDYGIIKTTSSLSYELKFPSWLKHDAKWISTNQIGSDDYSNTLGYLVDKGLFK